MVARDAENCKRDAKAVALALAAWTGFALAAVSSGTYRLARRPALTALRADGDNSVLAMQGESAAKG